jgi:hypothetical protein
MLHVQDATGCDTGIARPHFLRYEIRELLTLLDFESVPRGEQIRLLLFFVK